MWLSDETLRRLREAVDAPDLSGSRYHVIERIGRGGMGSVYLAEDAALSRRVALKVLDFDDPDGELAARLGREARILAQLEHPGIVPVHDVGRLPDGRVFYAMRFVEGQRLDRHVAAHPEINTRLRLFQRICEAVAFANDRGVLHRDLKPDNVMVGPFGEVLVMDWGIAKLLGEREGLDTRPGARETGPGAVTAHGAVLGTPGFMAPEQARGAVASLDRRTDVYSLGALLRFLLPEDAPRPLRSICAQAMSFEPARRYPGALELAADVGRYLDGQRVSAHREGIAGALRRLYARHKVAFWLVVAYLIVRGAILTTLGR